MEQTGMYTTKCKGENGKVYDLGKFEFVPDEVLVINAWTERIHD